MHILYICEFFPSLTSPVFSGGVEARCYYIAKEVSKKHVVTVISRRKIGEKPREVRGDLTIYRLGGPTKSAAATIPSLFSRAFFVLQSFSIGLGIEADIVEGSNYITFFPAYWLGIIKRIPKVAYYPDVLVGQWKKQFGLVLGSIGETCEKIVAGFSWDSYITTADTVKKKMGPLKIKKNKICLIPCGVDCLSLAKIRNKAIKTNTCSIITISRLISYKRVDWVIRVVNELKSQFPDIKLTIIGEGPEKNTLTHLVQKLHLENQVTFKSKLTIKTLYSQLASAKLLVHPSLVEGFGIVLVEAAALGTPFIAADIPTSCLLQESLRSGEVFKQKQFKELVEKTKSILSNEEEYKQLQKNGIENATIYDWKSLADQTINLYSDVIANPDA